MIRIEDGSFTQRKYVTEIVGNGLEAVVFDLNGTLAPKLTLTNFIVGLDSSQDIPPEIKKYLTDGKLPHGSNKEPFLKLWKATGRATRDFLTGVFETWPLREGAHDLVAQIHARNLKTCLITGSVDLHAEVAARRLHIPHYFANTPLIWDEQGNLVDYDFCPDQTGKKIEQLLGFCQQEGISPQQCLVVGDDNNDAGLFALTGKGVAAKSSTSHYVKGVAWKQVNHLTDIEGLLD